MSDAAEYDGPSVLGERAADRLLRYLDYECAQWQVERPSHPQVAAVLHALADHTAIQAALEHRPDPSSPWPQATSLGRWYHDTADQIERPISPGSVESICTCPEGHEAHTFEGALLADHCPTHGTPPGKPKC